MPTLNWIGKDKVINHDLEVPYHVLDKKYTYNADESDNMIIHGDNLTALKSLLPKYEGKVDCVYIDPPYNTGNEGWVYNDNVNDPHIKAWLGKVVGAEGDDLSRHDKWLCMMYPRLKILNKLLSENGIIFISIDDNELYNLKFICDEIFGISNYLGTIIWSKKRKGSFLSKKIVSLTEYALVYSKKSSVATLFGGVADAEESQPIIKRTNAIGTLRFKGNTVSTKLKDGEYLAGEYGKDVNLVTLENDIIVKNGFIINDFSLTSHFTWSQKYLEDELDKGTRVVINTMNFQPRVFRAYGDDNFKGFGSLVNGVQISGTNEDAYEQLEKIFGEKRAFDYSKPVNYVKTLIDAATHFKKNALVLDCFAGSGTTGHAVAELNASDSGKRKYILVEMMDYAENITCERMRKVISGYDNNPGLVTDFSYYELGKELFIDNKINKDVDIGDLRDYIFYSSAKEPVDKTKKYNNKYMLGVKENTSYYFYYEKDKECVLNYDFLSTIDVKTDAYVIYADACTLPQDVLLNYHISFKKTPRDIVKF